MNQHPIKTLPTQGLYQPLNMSRSIGCAIGDGQALDPHDLVEPAVQVATVAARTDVLFHGHSPAVLPEDPVIVVDEATRSLVPGRGLANRLLDPENRRVGRDVGVDDSA